jgi:hypothetical protein
VKALRSIRVPVLGGRFAYLPRTEDAAVTARQLFGTRLHALHRDQHGHEINDKVAEFVPGLGYDLGSGLVTNIGVLALAGDSQWPQTSIVTNLFKLLKYHASGKGVTAAAFTDIQIETDSTVGGQTPVVGTQVFTHDQVATTQKWVSVATIAYTGTEAVTEWGLFNDTTLSRTTGSPFTATTANTGTVTATPLTASSSSVRGETQNVVKTTTTPRYALITSNTTSVLTLSFSAAIGWMVTTTGVVGSTPGATEAYTLRPVMWDRKVFSAINVVNLDSIQYTYSLTIASAG